MDIAPMFIGAAAGGGGPMSQSGQVALVTGGGRGMGQLAAWRLAERGFSVAVVDVNRDGLAVTAQRSPERIRAFPGDVTDRDAMRQIVKEVEGGLGPLTRVMNAAGIARVGSLLHQDPDDIMRMMEINYGGTVNVCRATLPGMLERGRGELVNFASLAGWVPQPKMGAYCATKFAVVAFSEALWMENRGRGVKFACVCPPAVQTPMLPDFFAQEGNRRKSMAIKPETVIDEIERCLGKDRFLVVPHATGKIIWRLRRHAPNLLRRALTASRFDIISAD
jgi:short-subunit dehydrogenase